MWNPFPVGVKLEAVFYLKEDFVIAPTDQAVPIHVTLICSHFFDLTIIWKLNLDCPLSNKADISIYM